MDPQVAAIIDDISFRTGFHGKSDEGISLVNTLLDLQGWQNLWNENLWNQSQLWRPLPWENGQQILCKVLFSPSRDPTEGTLKIGVVNILASVLLRIHIRICCGAPCHLRHGTLCVTILLHSLVAVSRATCGVVKRKN